MAISQAEFIALPCDEFNATPFLLMNTVTPRDILVKFLACLERDDSIRSQAILELFRREPARMSAFEEEINDVRNADAQDEIRGPLTFLDTIAPQIAALIPEIELQFRQRELAAVTDDEFMVSLSKRWPAALVDEVLTKVLALSPDLVARWATGHPERLRELFVAAQDTSIQLFITNFLRPEALEWQARQMARAEMMNAYGPTQVRLIYRPNVDTVLEQIDELKKVICRPDWIHFVALA